MQEVFSYIQNRNTWGHIVTGNFLTSICSLYFKNTKNRTKYCLLVFLSIALIFEICYFNSIAIKEYKVSFLWRYILFTRVLNEFFILQIKQFSNNFCLYQFSYTLFTKSERKYQQSDNSCNCYFVYVLYLALHNNKLTRTAVLFNSFDLFGPFRRITNLTQTRNFLVQLR